MLGIDYGSDSDSSLPSSPNPNLPAPKRPPKKITIALPAISAAVDDNDKQERPTKKRKVGAGSSALLSMLPVPKQAAPVPPPHQRVLGGGSGPGLVFSTTPKDAVPSSIEDPAVEQSATSSSTSVAFRPMSLAKGKRNISLEEGNVDQPVSRQAAPVPPPVADFFSLGRAKPASTANIPISKGEPTVTPLPSSISSAPELQAFEPPEPTPTDPYPGYYQMPSGTWAAYDAEYYGNFTKKWERDYNAHIRALEKGTIGGFEALRDASIQEVDALKEMEKAKKEIQEREEKKAITLGAGGAPVAPKMTINASKLSGIARSRHQLSTLLKEAYENREALEERIAEGKRNRKEAGNKYGF